MSRWLLLLVCACSTKPSPRPVHDDARRRADAAPIDAANPNWANAYDFDGDHVPDAIRTTYSGGGHCCYKIAVGLSASRKVIELPFELDGGYESGFDLSQPWNFAIDVAPDGIASLRMRIASYSGRAEAIPLEWVKQYGIRGHGIRVSLRDGMRVENIASDCAASLAAVRAFTFAGWEGSLPCHRADVATATRGLPRVLGSAKQDVETKREIVEPDRGPELVYSLGPHDDIVRIDFDLEHEATVALDALGPPEVKLPYSLWGFTQPKGQWVWASRGVVAYVDRTDKMLRHVGLFAATDIATYLRDLAWPQ